ncbi:tyrosine-type recombinase/integrase [Deinococcus sp. HMF7620]|uniref:Tyrosine-type recombinase/integrase n=1 Tax=Deinococcus arboris TaxID=2682977 RepID=A0A7C9HU68_9DEIO|nr:site-specific integrase [Deinococcus arboris]MVN89149.1 tyrosine-type recombinase/integrase [Deinococcus arboris]
MPLVHYQGTALAHADTWLNLHDDELRRRAVQAAASKETDTLLSLMRAYLTQHGKSGVLTSPRTVEAYTLGGRQFLTYAGDQALNLLRPGRHDAQRYVQAMLAAGRQPAGVQLKVAAAATLYRALRWAGATEADPFREVRIPRDPTSGLEKRPPYTEEELVDVLHHADEHTAFLLFLIAHAGLRISEALALEWTDLDEMARRLHVRSGKGRKARRVTMSVRLARAARHFRTLYGPGGPEHARYRPRDRAATLVFRYGTQQAARYHLGRLFERAGVPFRGFHPGRKYAGTRLLQQIQDFGRVAAHLGHASIDTTRKGYAQLAADDLKNDVAGW